MRIVLCFLFAFCFWASAQVTPYSAVKNTAAEVASTPIPGSPPPVTLTVNMLGYSAVNDGQGGLFYWDYASAAIASFDAILSSNPAYASNGRWLRLVGSTVSFDGIAANGGSGTNINLFGTTYISNGQVQTATFIDGAHLAYDQRGSYFAGFTDNAASQEFVAQQTPLISTNIAALLAVPHPIRGQYATVLTGALAGPWQYCFDETTPDNGWNVRRPDDIPTDADAGRWIPVKVTDNNQYDVRWFGAVVDDGVDDTDAINLGLTFAVTNGVSLFFPAGTYSVSSFIMPENSSITLSDTAILKANHFPTTTNGYVITMTSNSKIIGNGTLDQNRANLNSVRGVPGSFDVAKFFALNIDTAANVLIDGLRFTNTFDEPIYCLLSTNVQVMNTDFVDILKGPAFVRSTNSLIQNMTIRDSPNMGILQAIYQHGFTCSYNTGTVIRGLRMLNLGGPMGGSTNFNSGQLSGVILAGETYLDVDGLVISGMSTTNVLLPTPMATDGIYFSNVKGVSIHGWGGGPAWEVNGCGQFNISDCYIDGSVIPSGGSNSGARGIFFRDDGVTGGLGPEFEDVQTRDRGTSSVGTINNVTVINYRRGFDIAGSYLTFTGCQAIGNDIYGFQIKDEESGIASLQWDQSRPIYIRGNQFIGCVARNNGSSGMAWFGASDTRVINSTFINNGQESTNSTGTGMVSGLYENEPLVSGTTNTLTILDPEFTANYRWKRATVFSTNGNSSYTILSNSTTVLYLQEAVGTVYPTDRVVVQPLSFGNNEFINCAFLDTQGVTNTLGGSFNPEICPTLERLTNIVFNRSDLIDVRQHIRLKGLATGGSSDDVIVRVVRWAGTRDTFEVVPLYLGDGTALSTASLSIPLVALTGTITTTAHSYGFGMDVLPVGFGRLTGVGSNFSYELDGHYFVGNGLGEYRRVWRQNSDTDVPIESPFTVQVAGASLSRVAFTWEGIPSQSYGVFLTSIIGEMKFINPRYSGNLITDVSVGAVDGYSVNHYDSATIDTLDTDDITGESIVLTRSDANPMLTMTRGGSSANFNWSGSTLHLAGTTRLVTTDSTTTLHDKNFAFTIPNYDTANSRLWMIGSSVQTNISGVSIGGSSSANTAATAVGIYGATNQTTTTGTQLFRVQMLADRVTTNATSVYLDVAGTLKQIKVTPDPMGTIYLSTLNQGGNVTFGTDVGDNNLAIGASTVYLQRYLTTLTGNKTVSFNLSGMTQGQQWKIVRTGLGAFTIDVGGLKTIPSGTAAVVEVMFNGTAMELIGYQLL